MGEVGAQPAARRPGRTARRLEDQVPVENERLDQAASGRTCGPAQSTQQLANAMPQLVWVADAEGRICFVNARAAGYSSGASNAGGGAVTGYPAAVHPDDVQRVSNAWQRAFARGEPCEIEHRVLSASGTYRWMRSRAVPAPAVDGRISHWYGSSIDVHDIKRAGERLNEAARQQHNFLTILAHELRNPLAPIRTGLATLRMALDHGELDHQLVERLRALMERHTNHLTRLIDAVLELERIDRGQIRLQCEELLLAGVVSEAVEAMRAQFEAAGHVVVIDLAAAPATLRADPVRLTQVLTNLLGNAAKYTPAGGRIELGARRRGDRLVIRVRDNGVGMPADLVPRVFDLFMQPAPAQGLNAPHGLGIGLTLVKRLVELHGGEVSAASDGPGCGSEFRVALPMSTADDETPTGHGGGSAGPGRVAQRVLIADDNEDAGETLAMMLRMLGHDVRTATNGVDAIGVGRAFRPALICLDLGMPVLDGLAAARAIRREGWGKAALLVAMTGYGQDEDRCATRAAGFDIHLVKPVDPIEIIRLLESMDRPR